MTTFGGDTTRRVKTVFFMVFLAAIAIHPSGGRSQSDDGWLSDFELADDLLNEDDCAAAWDVIWPWAKQGRAEARGLLASAFFFHGLMPPGSGDDMVSQNRHFLIMMVHGAPIPEAWQRPGAADYMRQLLIQLLEIEATFTMGGNNVIACLDTGTKPTQCVANAVEDGFIPDFESYAREIDALSQLVESQPARCLSHE